MTDSILEGLSDALSVAAAGGPADVYGYDDELHSRKFQQVMLADIWVQDMLAHREAKKRKSDAPKP